MCIELACSTSYERGLFTALFAVWCAAASAEKRDYQVAQGSDDAEEAVSSGNMSLTSSDLELISDGSTAQLVGIRFQAVEIPQGATITNAFIEFETDETNSGATSVTIQGEDVDDAPTFTTGNSNISNRTRTTASVAWNSIPAWNTTSERHVTPDLTAIVQEIVDRGGWSPGNDMVFIITGSGERTAESFNGESANSPILRVEFDGINPAPGAALCYGVADGGDRFTIIDLTDGTVDTDVGPLGATVVEAIAIDPNGLDVYGADADELGRIDIDTGAFLRLIAPFGTGGGSAGNITFDDVDSLAFDHDDGTLWGVDARGGADALFQIDPDTGAHVPDAFGVGTDYVLITGTGIGTQIDEIAIDPSTGTMYASDTTNSQLITVNTTTGVGTIIGGFGGTVDMEGMGFHSDGTLYGSEGQRVYSVNTSTGAATQIGSGDTLTVGSDYEGFDCHFTALARAVITRLDASTDGGHTVVEWDTASEDGTAGFYLYRYDYALRQWRALHEALLPALVGAPQGGTYRFSDDSGIAAPHLYALLEVETTGRVAERGVYAPRPRPNVDVEPAAPFTRRARRALRRARAALKRDLSGRGRAKDGLKVRVRERGTAFLSARQIAQAMGDEELRFWVGRQIAARRIALTRRGLEVSWLPSPDGSGLSFFAVGEHTLETDEDVYRLRFRAGSVMRSTRLAAAAPPSTTPTFRDTIDVESDVFPATVVASDPESDYWFWGFVSAGSPSYQTRSLPFEVHALEPATSSLTVRLFGATGSGIANEHHVLVRVNGIDVGETTFRGIGAHTVSFDVPAGVVSEGAGTLEIENVGRRAPYSIVYIDGFSLSYARRYEAAGGQLEFRGDRNPAITLTGFDPSTTPLLLDITRPLSPRVVSVRSTSYFTTLSPSHAYIAVDDSGLEVPVLEPWIEPKRLLRSRAHRADYLVIAADDLAEAATELADYRSSQGLDTKIVTRSEIENEFSDGFRSPAAVRRFLEHARRRWQRSPRYVVLVGEGSLDYRDLLGHGDSALAPVMARSADGLYASDGALAPENDDSALPALAIGRIPVATPDELAGYVQKLRAFESGALLDELLLLSDSPDVGGAFREDSDRLARVVSDYVRAASISLEELPVDLARAQLFAKLEDGAALITYAGHGGLDRLSNQGLLTAADAAALESSAHPSIIVSMSCSTNRFDLPGFDSLGEALVRQPGGGAIALWGPAGMTPHGQSVLLTQLFLEETFARDHRRLGDAVLAAQRRYAALPDADRLLITFHVLGDPAVELPR